MPESAPVITRSLTGESPAAAVGISPWSGWSCMVWVSPGWELLLTGVLGLVVLLGGIGHDRLVTHGPFDAPPFARQTLTGRCSGGQDGCGFQQRQRFNWEPQSRVGARGVIIGSATVQSAGGPVCVFALQNVSQAGLRETVDEDAEMLIISFGVSEVLLSTLVFTCETCGNNAARIS